MGVDVNMDAKEALEIVRAGREELLTHLLNAELRIKRASAKGDEVSVATVEEILDALALTTSKLSLAALRIEGGV